MGGFSDSKQTELHDGALPILDGPDALTATLRLGPGGRVVIPAEMREAMALKQGDALIAKLSGGELTMVTLMGLVSELQAITDRRVPADVSLVDEFIAEKRAEAAREEQD